METLSSILPVIVLLFIGVLCRNKRIISKAGIEGLQSLVMNISLPVGLFLTFFNAHLTWDTAAFTAVIFIINAVGYPFGKLICRLFHQNSPFLPFAMTTSEDGMIGYTLLALLLTGNQMTTFALMDIGQVLAFFIVTYQILKNKLTGEKASVKGALKNIVTTPLLVGMLAGIICSATGISSLVNAAGISPMLESLCNYISAPTNAAILIVIGYHIDFGHIRFSKLMGAIGMRALQQGILCVIVLGLFSIIGGKFVNRITTLSVIAIMILPGSYLLPIYVQSNEDKSFYASMISGYTILSILGFIVLRIVW